MSRDGIIIIVATQADMTKAPATALESVLIQWRMERAECSGLWMARWVGVLLHNFAT